MKYFGPIMGFLILGFFALFGALAAADAAPLAQTAQEGQGIFQMKCASCHTIGGGKLVGPDLEGVTGRRDLDWLANFIQNPDQMIASGDPLAVQLLAESNNVPMPNLALKDAEVQALLAYLENPQAAGELDVQPPAALPSGSALAGQKLFSGEIRLSAGGTSCIACHTVGGSSALGGGSLGPDLTHAFSRLSEQGLASSLNTIVFPTMQGPFQNRPLTPQEQADLIAYLKWADSEAPPPPARSAEILFGAGAAGAMLLFAGMAVFWPKQRESLSSRLRRGG